MVNWASPCQASSLTCSTRLSEPLPTVAGITTVVLGWPEVAPKSAPQAAAASGLEPLVKFQSPSLAV